MRRLVLPLLAASVLALPALANPPPGAKPLSEIIRQLEASPDVGQIREVEWDDDAWEVTYVTRDGSRREVKLDPMTAQPRGR